MVPLNRSGLAPVMKMALKLMRMTMIATTLKYEDDLDDADDTDDDSQEAEGGRLETFLICAGPGSQPTLVKRLTFR